MLSTSPSGINHSAQRVEAGGIVAVEEQDEERQQERRQHNTKSTAAARGIRKGGASAQYLPSSDASLHNDRQRHIAATEALIRRHAEALESFAREELAAAKEADAVFIQRRSAYDAREAARAAETVRVMISRASETAVLLSGRGTWEVPPQRRSQRLIPDEERGEGYYFYEEDDEAEADDENSSPLFDGSMSNSASTSSHKRRSMKMMAGSSGGGGGSNGGGSNNNSSRAATPSSQNLQSRRVAPWAVHTDSSGTPIVMIDVKAAEAEGERPVWNQRQPPPSTSTAVEGHYAASFSSSPLFHGGASASRSRSASNPHLQSHSHSHRQSFAASDLPLGPTSSAEKEEATNAASHSASNSRAHTPSSSSPHQHHHHREGWCYGCDHRDTSVPALLPVTPASTKAARRREAAMQQGNAADGHDDTSGVNNDNEDDDVDAHTQKQQHENRSNSPNKADSHSRPHSPSPSSLAANIAKPPPSPSQRAEERETLLTDRTQQWRRPWAEPPLPLSKDYKGPPKVWNKVIGDPLRAEESETVARGHLSLEEDRCFGQILFQMRQADFYRSEAEEREAKAEAARQQRAREKARTAEKRAEWRGGNAAFEESVIDLNATRRASAASAKATERREANSVAAAIAEERAHMYAERRALMRHHKAVEARLGQRRHAANRRALGESYSASRNAYSENATPVPAATCSAPCWGGGDASHPPHRPTAGEVSATQDNAHGASVNAGDEDEDAAYYDSLRAGETASASGGREGGGGDTSSSPMPLAAFEHPSPTRHRLAPLNTAALHQSRHGMSSGSGGHYHNHSNGYGSGASPKQRGGAHGSPLSIRSGGGGNSPSASAYASPQHTARVCGVLSPPLQSLTTTTAATTAKNASQNESRSTSSSPSQGRRMRHLPIGISPTQQRTSQLQKQNLGASNRNSNGMVGSEGGSSPASAATPFRYNRQLVSAPMARGSSATSPMAPAQQKRHQQQHASATAPSAEEDSPPQQERNSATPGGGSQRIPQKGTSPLRQQRAGSASGQQHPPLYSSFGGGSSGAGVWRRPTLSPPHTAGTAASSSSASTAMDASSPPPPPDFRAMMSPQSPSLAMREAKRTGNEVLIESVGRLMALTAAERRAETRRRLPFLAAHRRLSEERYGRAESPTKAIRDGGAGH